METLDINFPSEWRFVPILKGKKAPIATDDSNWYTQGLPWADVQGMIGSRIKAFSQSKKTAGKDPWYTATVGAIGCLAGTASDGLLFLDHDGASCSELIKSWGDLPQTWVVSSGRDGHCQFAFKVPQIFWDGIANRQYKTGVVDADGKDEHIELRWNGCQSLVFGEHPDTKQNYQWTGTDGEIAEAPLWLIEKMLKPEFVETTPAKQSTYKGSQARSPMTDQECALDYLDAIDAANLDWYEWRNCLLAAHQAGLSENDVIRWSEGSSKHTASGFSDVWRHIKGGASNPVSIGTLGYLAKQNGWKPKARQSDIEWKHSSLEAKTPKPVEPGDIQSQTAALKQEVERYLAESDTASRLLMRSKICSHYQISKQDFIDIVIDHEQSKTPAKRTRFSGAEFFAQSEESISYRFNRYLPVGEQILLASAAGVGKTNIITDAVHSALSGEPFLGEGVLAPCKVLFVSSDESEGTTRRRLNSRGTDMVMGENLAIWTDFDITKLEDFEMFLDDWRPDLVCMDSITTICQNIGISEKDPEFAMHLYKLKNLWSRYGCSAIITHHANKDPMAKGLAKISGSARIPAAFWGVFLLERVDENPENPFRWLQMVKGREVQEFKVKISTNPRGEWAERGCFVVSEDEDRQEIRSKRDMVLDYIQKAGVPLEYAEIKDIFPYPPSTLYRILDRLEDDRLLIKRRSKTNYKKWVYLTSTTTPLYTFSNESENKTATTNTSGGFQSFSLHSQDSKNGNETGNRVDGCGSDSRENGIDGENGGKPAVSAVSGNGFSLSGDRGVEGGRGATAGENDSRFDSRPGDSKPQRFQHHSKVLFGVGSQVRIIDRSHPNAYQVGHVTEMHGMNGSSQFLVKAYDDSFSNWAKAHQLEEFNLDDMEEVED